MNTEEKAFLEEESLAGRTGKGALWLVGSRLWTQVMSLTVGVALARLLEPSDFGLLGMVLVVTGLFGMLSDMGLSTAVIQKQDLRPDEISSVFWFNLAVATVLSILLAAFSPLVANFYSQPRIVPIMCVLIISFPISALAAVQSALLRKAMRFGVITKIQVVSSLVSGLLALAAAFADWNVWALVLQQLLMASIGTAALWLVTDWRPVLRFSWRDLDRIWRFGMNLTGFQIVNYGARNADNFLIGRFLGATQLGYYNLAYMLMVYPISNLISVAQGVLLPAFSEVQSQRERLADAYIKTCRYLAFLILPIMCGLALVAREAVFTVYGEKWDNAGRVLEILCWVGTFQPFASLAGTVVIARGFARWFFWWGMIVSTISIFSFVIGLRWGIVGVAVSYLVAQSLITLIGMPIQYRKVDISVRHLLRALAMPGIATIVMCAVVLSIKTFVLHGETSSPGFRLCLCVLAGGASYAGFLFLMRNHFWGELRLDLARAFGSKRTALA
jgi:O-antigen/teichoic acid export membrane protein